MRAILPFSFARLLAAARGFVYAAALLLTGCATAPPIAHLDPIQLNELAVAKVRAGDTSTAWILLERAALLAPQDARIAANLRTMRDWRAGKRSAAPSASAPDVRASTPFPLSPSGNPAVPSVLPPLPPAPPPIWNGK